MRGLAWIILMMAFLSASFLQAQNADAFLKDQEIKIGEQTTIDLEVKFSAAEQNVILPSLLDTITKFIEIVKVSDPDTTFDDEDITIKSYTQTITITSWDSGYHAIPPFKFVIGSDTVETKPMVLAVSSIPIEAEADIKDIKEIMDVPFSLTDWMLSNKWEISTVLLILLLAIAAFFIYKRYANRPKEESIKVVPKEEADVIARRKLNELQSKELWQKGEVKTYHTDLSYILREYIENRYHLPALEATTDEIITSCRKSTDLSEEVLKRLHETLLRADLAKYAKQQPLASENEASMKAAVNFVETTKFVPIQESHENEEIEKVDTHA